MSIDMFTTFHQGFLKKVL